MSVKLMLIKWRDHYSVDEWTDPSTFHPQDYEVVSAGWVAVENDTYVCLAGSLSNSNMTANMMCILKADILDKKEVSTKIYDQLS